MYNLLRFKKKRNFNRIGMFQNINIIHVFITQFSEALHHILTLYFLYSHVSFHNLMN